MNKDQLINILSRTDILTKAELNSLAVSELMNVFWDFKDKPKYYKAIRNIK